MEGLQLLSDQNRFPFSTTQSMTVSTNPSLLPKKEALLSLERMPRYPAPSVLGSLRLLDYLGTIVFALSGSMLAAVHHMDAFGCVMIGFITAVGGGTVRDCIWARGTASASAFWLEESEYMYLALCGSFAGFAFCWLEQPGKGLVDFLVLWGDTLGLAAFSIIGTLHAVRMESSFVAAVICAVVNSTCGGVIRDALLGLPVRVMHNHEEVYAETVAIGSMVYLLCRKLDVALPARVLIGMLTVVVLRVYASHYRIRNIVAWASE